MSGGKPGLPPLQGDQALAVSPADQVWLSASAGTGKTQVLTARVFRLLLEPGVNPDAILCLTFTKAGATSDGQTVELEWEGAIGCIATFTHGFTLTALGPTQTQVHHYEKFTGGVVGCLPAPAAAGIVVEGYVKFELALKAACEKA